MKKQNFSQAFFLKAVIVFIALVFLIKLVNIQLLGNSYKAGSKKNAIRESVQYSSRGLIYDRNGVILTYNEPVYNLQYIPYLSSKLDTLAISKLLGMPIKQLTLAIGKARKYSYYQPSIIYKNISLEKFSKIQERLHEYPGITFQVRTSRKYNFNSGAHLLGYVGEITKQELALGLDYDRGDKLGKSGVERSYESFLKGSKGIQYVFVDAKGVIQGPYNEGKSDVLATKGNSLTLSVDAHLQDYVEKLLRGKSGAVVAINPSTGGLLSLASSPSYSPNLLVSKNIGTNYTKLFKDTLKPLFNRAIMAEYAPGSTFKTVQALIALQDKKITTTTRFTCNKQLIGCHNHPPVHSLAQAIKVSCNSYFYRVYERLIADKSLGKEKYEKTRENYQEWVNKVKLFGFGSNISSDIYGAKKGALPTSNYYDKIYGKNRWLFSTIYSLGIGQGEILTTPLQLANLSCIIANKGYYYSPHLISEVKDKFKRKYVGIDSIHFKTVIEGMYEAVNVDYGTARRARIKDVEVCGKTGTAENAHGQDHSIFIAFAPREKPKIALAVFLENSGYGGSWAAPIASLIIQKYLNNTTNKVKEERILNANRYNMIQK